MTYDTFTDYHVLSIKHFYKKIYSTKCFVFDVIIIIFLRLHEIHRAAVRRIQSSILLNSFGVKSE